MPSGESLQAELQRPLLYSSGVKPGLQLSLKVREKIATGKYVDFYDILYPDAEQTLVMSVATPSSTPTLSFTPHKRRQLSPTEWCSAWDDFMAVYLP